MKHWNILAKIWLCLLGVIALFPIIGIACEINTKGVDGFLKAVLNDGFGLILALLWDWFYLTLIMRHSRFAMWRFSALNVILAICTMIYTNGSSDGCFFSACFLAIGILTPLFTWSGTGNRNNSRMT